MSEGRVTFCDLCNAPLDFHSMERHGSGKVQEKYGFIYTHGFSCGGWGSREDLANKSGVCCHACIKIFCEASHDFQAKIRAIS